MIIVVLTTEGPANFYIINEIHKHHPVKKVFFQFSQSSSVGSKFKKLLNWSKVKGHVRFVLEDFLFKKEKQLKEEYEEGRFPKSLDPEIAAEKVLTFNSIESIEKIKREEPDLIVVQGTDILKERVLEIAKTAIINLHPAIVPDYRGGGLPFWIFYNRDFDKLGVTVHVCTKKLDAGPILGQAYYQLQKDDEIYMLSYKMNALFVDLTKRIIGQYKEGTVDHREQGRSDKTWTRKELTIAKQLVARKRFRDYVDSL